MNSFKPTERDLYLYKDIARADGAVKEIVTAINNINREDAALIKKAELLNLTYTPAPIKLYIHCSGGCVYAMFAIIDAIKKSKVPVHTINTGLAASAASLVLMAGAERYAYSNSTVMIHGVNSVAWGTSTDIKDDLAEMERLEGRMMEFVFNHSGISMARLKEIVDLKKDWYIDSTEALRLGIVDGVI